MQEFLSQPSRPVPRGDELEAIPLPDHYLVSFVLRSEVGMFEGLETEDKDPWKSLHVGDVAVPELAPDEAYVAVMASAINFNTVWTSIFQPLPTFGFLDRLGKESAVGQAARPRLPRGGVGRLGRGRDGSAVRDLEPGDKVTVHCNYVDDQSPSAHDDSILADNQRIWGFETNFGGLADLSVVKANQLMPKPKHLTWEEAARRECAVQLHLLPDAGLAQRRPDDPGGQGPGVGGLGRARRIRRPVRPQWRGDSSVGVVSSQSKVDLLHELGVEAVIDRKVANYRFWEGRAHPGRVGVASVGQDIRALVGDDVDIVFEHPGRQTMGASVFAAKRGGTIVTCAATSGYMIEYDNRHLWMKLKTIKGSHFANYREAWDANQLVCEGKILPPLSAVHTLEGVGDAAHQVHKNLHEGKIGVLCLAPEEGLGSTTPSSAPRWARTGSPCSGGTGHDRAPPHRDRPRGHRRPRPRGGHRLLPETFGATVDHRRGGGVRRGGRGPLKVADSYIQLLTPTNDGSPVAKYLEKKGPGLHHVGYRVADCGAALQSVNYMGARSSTRHPVRLRRGTTVAFVHPKGAFGTLIELVQE